MTTDIREQAAKAAREWATKGEATGDRWATGENCYIDGYLAGYKAAKAEADPCAVCLHNPEDCAMCKRRLP